MPLMYYFQKENQIIWIHVKRIQQRLEMIRDIPPQLGNIEYMHLVLDSGCIIGQKIVEL